jgi:hypothetical protein
MTTYIVNICNCAGKGVTEVGKQFPEAMVAAKTRSSMIQPGTYEFVNNRVINMYVERYDAPANGTDDTQTQREQWVNDCIGLLSLGSKDTLLVPNSDYKPIFNNSEINVVFVDLPVKITPKI